MFMQNGFYNELDELKNEDNEANFGFLENLTVSDEDNAFNFLHGDCGLFAAMLSDVYGYEIECIRETQDDDFPGKLIHAYCVTTLNNEKAYIDVRGITTDSEVFYEEFENQMTYLKETNTFLFVDYEGYEKEAIVEHFKCKDELFDGDLEGWVDEDIKKFICNYRDYYDAEKVRSLLPERESLDNIIKNCSDMSRNRNRNRATERSADHQL